MDRNRETLWWIVTLGPSYSRGREVRRRPMLGEGLLGLVPEWLQIIRKETRVPNLLGYGTVKERFRD